MAFFVYEFINYGDWVRRNEVGQQRAGAAYFDLVTDWCLFKISFKNLLTKSVAGSIISFVTTGCGTVW